MSISRNVLAAIPASLLLGAFGCGMYPEDYGTFSAASDPPPTTAACTEEPTTLASVRGLRGDLLLIDDAALYVVASDTIAGAGSGERIYMVPKSGAAPQLLAADQHGVVSIALAPWFAGGPVGALYWTTSGRGAQERGAVWKVAGVGAAPVAVVTDRASPGGLVVGDTHVYWGESRADGAAIVWAPLDGGEVTTWQLLPGRRVPTSIVFGFEGLTWSTQNVVGTTSEVTSAMLPLSFGATTTIDMRPGAPLPIESAFGALFLGGADGVTVVPTAPNPRVTIAAMGPVRHLAASSDVVYFVDTGLHALYGALPGPLAGPPRQIASDVADGSLRFDAACVYFVDQAAGSLRMVHR